MRARAFAAILAVLPTLLLGSAGAAPVERAPSAPTLKPVEKAPIVEKPPVVKTPPAGKIAQTGKLTVENQGGAPGEKRTFDAVLMAGNAPVPQRYVHFRIEGKDGSKVPGGGINAGMALTDATGKAKVTLALPELAQGTYALKVSSGGDDNVTAASAEANLVMVKAGTSIVLSPETFQSADPIDGGPQPNSAAPRIRVNLFRETDHAPLGKPLSITINGNSQTHPLSIDQVVLPANATEWNVKVKYAGSDSYTASTAERTYKKD